MDYTFCMCANTGHEAICILQSIWQHSQWTAVLFVPIRQHGFQLIFVKKKEKRAICASPSAVSRHMPACSPFPSHPPLLISQRSLRPSHWTVYKPLSCSQAVHPLSKKTCPEGWSVCTPTRLQREIKIIVWMCPFPHRLWCHIHPFATVHYGDLL